MATKKDLTVDPLAIRSKLGMNQTDFWSRIGVTQSGGSRYESGRNIPRTARKLLVLAYGTPSQVEKLMSSLRGQKTVSIFIAD